MEFKRKAYLPLNLQLFADDNEDEQKQKQAPPKIEFTDEQQAEINRIVQQRLERERKKHDDDKAAAEAEAARKKLEDDAKYEQLYRDTQTELETLRTTAKTAELEATKTRLLVEAGYSAEQLARVTKYVVGGDEEAITASINELKADMPPTATYVDPNGGNSRKQSQKTPDPMDAVRERLERLKKAGQIR